MFLLDAVISMKRDLITASDARLQQNERILNGVVNPYFKVIPQNRIAHP